MAGNKSLTAAARAKQDEFYTQLTDIEKELRYYKKHFKDKTVLCNCDDPFESNFFKYFVLNFNRLGLKKLIATCYTGSPIANKQLSLFDILGEDEETENKPYKAVVTTVYDKTGDGGVDMYDVAELFKSGENELSELKGDGDFRSPECLALMNEADIVVTNPPFSLFREYISVLMENQKEFLIIGNQNAITYKEVFHLLMTNQVWLGVSSPMEFVIPANVNDRKNTYVRDDGTIIAKFGNVCWFTNLDLRKRHEEIILVKRYSPDLYPSFYNFDAINVNKTSDIPCDYAGIMGVPITFMDKFSPDQFDIIGLGIANLGLMAGVKPYTDEHRAYRKNVQKRGTVDGDLYMVDEDGHPIVPYARILIRNKHPEAPKEG